MQTKVSLTCKTSAVTREISGPQNTASSTVTNSLFLLLCYCNTKPAPCVYLLIQSQ
jgi:hypothetical protein